MPPSYNIQHETVYPAVSLPNRNKSRKARKFGWVGGHHLSGTGQLYPQHFTDNTEQSILLTLFVLETSVVLVLRQWQSTIE